MKDFNKTVKLSQLPIDELSEQYQALVLKAEEAWTGSYSPYSKYPVGAAVLLNNGEIIIGSNQENAAYPSGLCAERTALFYAGSRFPKIKIIAIAISVVRKQDHFPFPCGGCLQVLVECESKQETPIDVLLKHPAADKVLIGKGMENFLPFAFRKEHLQG